MPFPNLTMAEIEAADEAGIKLEITEGLPTWEFHPGLTHQLVIGAVYRSVKRTKRAGKCACLPVEDLLIRFPDGSLKRPDLSIFCETPAEKVEAVTSIPAAVVEVVSAGSGIKDLQLNPPFYLKHGVLDVIVLDPASGKAALFTAQGRTELNLPTRLELQCGCSIAL